MANEVDAAQIELLGVGAAGNMPVSGSPLLAMQQQATQVVQPDAGNVIVLGEGQAIDTLLAQGRDLVIVLTDGTRIVVPDGAIFIPQIVVQGVPVPVANVAALLVGNEPEPAAGANQSSGGNFFVDPGDIQDAFDLGDLLPYTELPFNVQFEEEVIPVPVRPNSVPAVTITGSAPTLTNDETNLGIDATASFSATFLVDYGADGPAAVDPLVFTLGVVAGPSGLTDTATGEAVILSVNSAGVIEGRTATSNALVFTITVDPTGTVTLDQQRAVRHADANDPDDAVTFSAANLITLTATATDSDGDTASATVNIGQNFIFRDDAPSIDVVAGPEAGVVLTTRDANTDGDPTDTDTATSTAAFGGVFSLTFAAGADGAATPVLSYALSVTDAVSGLTSGGAAINLYLIDGRVVGSTAATQGGVNAGNTVFDLSVSSTGAVTLNQYQQIDHAVEGTTTAPFDDQLVVLANGKIALTARSTITDGDGDTATDSATVDLGGNVRFADDGPTVTTTGTGPALVVDETNLTVNASASFAANFVTAFGADGPAASGSLTYALDVVAGPSGLVDTATGQNVILSLTAGGVVEGRTAVSGALVFTVTVAADGTVTLDQQRAVRHADANNPNDTATLSAAKLITLTATARDFDGDTSSATLNVGQNFLFRDDAPVAADDTDSLTEDGPVFTTGNVITDAEANGDNGADVTGADGAVIENPGTFAGTYGTLVLGADGTYTYTLSAFGISQLSTLSDGEFFTEVFEYVLIDGDGDTSSATLTITLNGKDDGVTITGLGGEAPEVVLDEDDLATPGDDQGSDQSDPLMVGGSFGVIAPDGLATVQVNGVAVVTAGAFVGPVTVANNGIYTVAITGWTPVFAADGVTVISATFTYSATLLDNTLAHSLPGQDAILEMLAVIATDSDGSSDSASLDVQIVDDVPTARDDMATQPIENEAFTINALANDIFGADGVDTSDPTKVFIATQATQGTVTYDPATGLFTYTPNAGAFGTDSFTYTIIDRDGDVSTATVRIMLQEDSKPQFVVSDNLTVDEDGLPGANVDSDPLQSDPAETASTGSATASGTITFSFGADVPTGLLGSIALINPSALNGQLVMNDDTPVTFALDGAGNLVGSAAGFGEVIRVVITGAVAGSNPGEVDYSYTVTLSQPVKHADLGNNENTQVLSGITFEVMDSDGDTARGSFNVIIVDDAPSIDVVAGPEAGVVLTTRDANTDGDPTDTDTATSTAAFGGVFSLTFAAGADGAATPVLSYALSVTDAVSGLTSGGAAINLY
ncbi:DUF5801 repeats-in-toxin domain-containing protein, partial [Erythrobacter sp. T5W1-R]|uniref:DUF5801 repeats-in-toxin domain-containing protein n=1 Tax=Erythrobacter sp. T5W1-R TaxID=3101752 RepID=UPI002AFF54DE